MLATKKTGLSALPSWPPSTRLWVGIMIVCRHYSHHPMCRLMRCCATALFVDVPYPSISYIYQSIGCSHALQPTKDDFAAPSIPTLTIRGFVRWESIETLLGPQEHVPFLQAAVRNFGLKNPETGESFPVDLPDESLPNVPDEDIMRWHKLCADKLRQQATPDTDDPKLRPALPPRHYTRTRESHLRNRSTPGRSPRDHEDGADYFNSKPLANGGISLRPQTSRETSYRTHLSPNDDLGRHSRTRRRSVPDNYYSPIASPLAPKPGKTPEDQKQSYSNPHQYRPSATSISSDDDAITPNQASVTANGTAPTPKLSYTNPTSARDTLPFSYPPSHGHAPSPTVHPRHRGLTMPYSRDTRERLASYKIPIDLEGKLSAPFLQSAGIRHVKPGNTAPNATSNSRSNSGVRPPQSGVRWGVNEINRVRRHSDVTVDSSSDSDDTAMNERDSVRRTKDRLVRPKMIQRRSGSHDPSGRYDRTLGSDRRDRDRERDDREPVRRRERRLSPDDRVGRRYVERPDGWR
jgi:hypothetical protein